MFAEGVEVYSSLDMTHLKVPIGSNSYVAGVLDQKLKKLKETVEWVAKMPQKHEAFSLLQGCVSACRVTHLARTVPPRQIAAFFDEFDTVLRAAFEELIGTELEDRWWRQCQMTGKNGGISLRSGKNTFGAQHVMSLLVTEGLVKRFVPDYDVVSVIKEECAAWFEEKCAGSIEIEKIVEHFRSHKEIDTGVADVFQGGSYKLSLAQTCELFEQRER